MRIALLLCAAAIALAVAVAAAARGSEETTLEARAVLPALTFAAGPPSGSLIGTAPINGVTPPFSAQPVQGISAVLDGPGDTYWAMPDNGYGAKENSADFLLRVYRFRPHFEKAKSGDGTVEVEGFVQLRDPDGRIPFPIVNSTGERLLTGGDFDIESVRIDRDGGFWFGDEFGPWLLHTDANGKVLEAPIPLPGVKSPQNQTLAPGETPNLGRSNGFEGTAIAPNRKTLYPMLEGPLTTDADRQRRFIYEFDLRRGAYTGVTWPYRTEATGRAIGDLTALDSRQLLVIERDNLQGPAADFKRIFVVDLTEVGPDGFLVKREVLNLLAIPDPDGISLPGRPGDFGLGDPFKFPFQTIESVLPLGGSRLLIANDNNFPFSAGRNPGLPDDNELIIVRVPSLR